ATLDPADGRPSVRFPAVRRPAGRSRPIATGGEPGRARSDHEGGTKGMSERSRRDAAAASPRDATSRSIPPGSFGGRRSGAPSSGTAAPRTGRDVLASGMAHRPVDVICAGMYRACSTWQYEVAAHLVEHHRRGNRLGYLMPDQYAGPE